ncbi:MAG: HEAT repeat domain-containing protein [Terriglobia bacterium]
MGRAQEGANTAANATNDSWAPELLYDIISSPNPVALESLYDAAFASGAAMVPQLVAALKDDRTAEFAAQSLAFMGGEDAFTALSKLVDDSRNLNLRRYYYGALGEIDTPQAANYLVHIIQNANREPDRTVTEAALIALTVRSDASLVSQLKKAEAGLTDPVIVDDLENSISVIQERAQYLASHKTPGGSLQDALNLYFEPALAESAHTTPAEASRAPAASQVHRAPPASRAPQARAAAPSAKVSIEHLTFSPNLTRALARVLFQDQGQSERFWVVLQKRYGDWTVASVWLRLEEASSGKTR